jgi:predicted nucleotidyltransferase component of viral defense system
VTQRPNDLGASVRDRLGQLARIRGDDVQLLLTRYANERLLHRLSVSVYANEFVLKGAALFTLWTGRMHRATRDLDLLGFGSDDLEHVRDVFREVLSQRSEPDGVEFDADTLDVQTIREGQEYGGARVALIARIAQARIRLQVDIGYGDAVTPQAEDVVFPALLEFPAPRLRAYPRQTVVAEKLEAMVHLGVANSRMKDFFDLAFLARRFDFDGATLVTAIRATFARRGTTPPDGRPIAWTPAFTADASKRTQWTAFLRKSGATEAVTSLVATVDEIDRFAGPPLAAAALNKTWEARWPAGGPWQT